MGTSTLFDERTSPGLGSFSKQPREARLWPGNAELYPGIPAGEWRIAAILADQVLAAHLLRGVTAAVRGRVLPETHFEFRGGMSRGGERKGMRPERARA
jgi:hypothetical protein